MTKYKKTNRTLINLKSLSKQWFKNHQGLIKKSKIRWAMVEKQTKTTMFYLKKQTLKKKTSNNEDIRRGYSLTQPKTIKIKIFYPSLAIFFNAKFTYN